MSLREEESTLLPTFAEHRQRSAPKVIHHYTTQEGLLGIIQTAELRATKVQYMNDATEFGLALRLARQRTFERNADDPRRRLTSNLDKIEGVNIFVACFCEEPDLLGQWRGYSGPNHGFSIAFDSERLQALAATHHFILGRCIYDTEVQTKIIDEAINFCLTEDDHNAGAALEFLLLEVGAFFKDAAFVEEREWRLISRPTYIHGPSIGFRPGTSMLTPYYKLPLGDDMNGLVRGVTIGPCPHPELSRASVQALLISEEIRKNGTGSRGYKATVTGSKVPYRNW